MKVRCKYNQLGQIQDQKVRNWLKEKYIRLDENISVGIEPGKEYCVYGVVFQESCPFFLVLERGLDKYPMPAYSGFFEIVDPRLSRFWQLQHQYLSERDIHYSFLVFPEWAMDPTFYERLVDGDEEVGKIFQMYRRMMEEEF